MRQLLHIRQTSSVIDYVSHFTSLTDQLKAYSSGVDPIYFTSHFIDGLRPELQASIIVQRPRSLDAACTLALLQEDAGGARTPTLMFGKLPQPTLPLPVPPKTDKPAAAQESASSSLTESKWATVKTYCKAMGLYYKCAAKWTRDHKCSPEVLHALNDLWDSFLEDDCTNAMSHDETPQEHLFLALSSSAVSGAPAPRTIQFVGSVACIPVTILLDSGSS